MSKTTYLEESAPESFDSQSALRGTASKLAESLEIAIEPSDVARLATALITCCAELRQREKSEKRAVASLPLEQIVAHLKTLPQTKRDEVCRAVSGADDDKALL